MDSNKLANWLQVIANFGLLGGLILVAMQINQNSDELKQNHLHARAQLIADDYVNLQGHQYTLMGDNPAASVAKAKVTPESLTEEEKIVVDAHLLAHYLILDSYEYIATQTGLYYDGVWQTVVPVVIARDFNYPYARSWWAKERQIKKSWTTELQKMFDQALGFSDSKPG